MDRFYKKAADKLASAADSATKSLGDLELVQKSKTVIHDSRTAIRDLTATQPFPYDALPTPTSIRLLRLEPSKAMAKAAHSGKPLKGDADDDENDVRFTMKTFELTEDLKFTALSYTWRQQRSGVNTWAHFAGAGFKAWMKDEAMEEVLPDPDEPLSASRKVTCNGHVIKVFENLFEALKQLRRARPGEWLWIDALCMNQSNTTELIAQIQIMGRIYQSAQLVVVWLGTFSGMMASGYKVLSEIAESGTPLDINPLYETQIGRGMREDWKLEFAALTAWHLANRSYFRRVWVIQEMCLAREVVYLHGKQEITFETLVASCKWSVDSGSRREAAAKNYAMQSLLAPYYVAHMRFLPTTLDARREFAKGNKWTLLQWFQTLYGRLASEPKDFVFGGLSLIMEDHLTVNQRLLVSDKLTEIPQRRPVGGNGATSIGVSSTESAARDYGKRESQSLIPRGLWPKLAPDYTASDSEVFINAAACLLTHGSLEELLRLSSRLRDKFQYGEENVLRPRIPEAFSLLPSWVPAVGAWTSLLTVDLVHTGVASPFSACSTLSEVAGHPLISTDGAMLSISAARFDQIATFGFEKDGPSDTTELRKMMRFLAQTPADEAIITSATVDDAQNTANNNNGITYDVNSNSTDICLLEAVATTICAGHVNGQLISPTQAGTWLCESMESRVQKLIAETHHTVTAGQKTLQQLEAKSTKKGNNIESFKTCSPDESSLAKKWRDITAIINDGLQLVTEVTAELNAVKVRYAHLQGWFEGNESVVVVRMEDDLERARLERKNSKEKELEQLLERSHSMRSDKSDNDSVIGGVASFGNSSTNLVKDAIGRGKMSISETTDRIYDNLNMWGLSAQGKYKRIMSDECKDFEEASIDVMTWRRICLTERGRLVLAPLWAETGDAVMLIPGVSVPFIFAKEEEDLEREEARIKEMFRIQSETEEGVNDWAWKSTKTQLDARMLEVEAQLKNIAIRQQKGDRWVLVGEAYVQGVMHGELASRLEIGRIGIV